MRTTWYDTRYIVYCCCMYVLLHKQRHIILYDTSAHTDKRANKRRNHREYNCNNTTIKLRSMYHMRRYIMK